MFLQSGLSKNITRYYIYSFFSLFILFDGTLSLYFLHELGLSFYQVTLTYAVFTFLVGILEIPTGVFADKLGYKKTISIASLCMIVASLGYSLSTTIYHLIVVEIFWALGFSLNSGTMDSFLYNSLKQSGEEKRFNSILGRGNALMFMGLSASAVLGGLLAKQDLALPVRLGFLPLIIPFLTVLTFKEPPIARSELNHFQHVKESFRFILFQPKLRFIIFYIAVPAVAFESVFKFSQTYMMQLGIPIPFISMSFSCSYLLSATGAFMGQRLNRFLGEKKMFLSLYIAIFITLLLLKVNTVFALTGLVILSPLFEGIHGPITAGFINRHTRSRIRATVNSITNFSRSLVIAIALPLFGLIAQYSIALIFFINAGLIFVGIFVVRIWYKKLPQKHLTA